MWEACGDGAYRRRGNHGRARYGGRDGCGGSYVYSTRYVHPSSDSDPHTNEHCHLDGNTYSHRAASDGCYLNSDAYSHSYTVTDYCPCQHTHAYQHTKADQYTGADKYRDTAAAADGHATTPRHVHSDSNAGSQRACPDYQQATHE